MILKTGTIRFPEVPQLARQAGINIAAAFSQRLQR
jgi:hypothetical protein